MRTGRKKLGRDFHIFLPLDHFADHSFVIKGFLTARLTALEQAVIALRVKKPLFVKASLLKAMVNIRGDDKIIFVLYQLKKVLIDRLRRILIAVDVDIPAPIRPILLQHVKGIKAAGVHIPKAIFPGKIRKVCFKPFAGVYKARRRRQSGTGTDYHGVTVL